MIVSNYPGDKAVDNWCNNVENNTGKVSKPFLEVEEFDEATNLFRFGCSSGRYHIETTKVTAGIRRDSQPPSKKRQAKRPPKLVQAAMHISRIPQHSTLKAK